MAHKLTLAVLALAMWQCALPTSAVDYALPQRLPGDCLSPGIVVPSAGLFPAQLIGTTPRPGSTTVQVLAARNFEVSYFSTYKVVTNKQMNETYVLYQCGTSAPSASEIPAGAKVFEIPLKSIAVPDTTAVAFLEALNLLDRVAFVTTYVNSPCMQALAFPRGCNQSISSYSDRRLAELDIPAVFAYQKDVNNRRSIAFSATADPGAINRAEWIKFVSLFFNKEPEANRLFNSINQTYVAVSQAAQSAAPSDTSSRKLVAWIQWWSSDTWRNPCSGPRGAISVNYPAYKTQITQAAGARILDLAMLQSFLDSNQARRSPYGASDPSVWICGNQTDVLRAMLRDVDIVIDESRYLDGLNQGTPNDQIMLAEFLTQFGLSTADTTSLKFLSNNGLLREDGRTNSESYTQWFERVVLRPDQVLADLVLALNPSVLQQSGLSSQLTDVQTSVPYFMRNVVRGQRAVLMTADGCSLSGCRLTSNAICPFVYKACDGSIVYASDSRRCAAPCSPPSPNAASATQPISFALLLVLMISALVFIRM